MQNSTQNKETPVSQTICDKTNGTNIQRTYKSRLFEMIFSEKTELLELYNAMNETNYENPELLEINTLENAIFMSMHNDISFIIDSRLTLYEHQSTYNPNLPLRCLLYTADLYSAMAESRNLYGTKIVEIPTPRFVIFYNGAGELEDVELLRLSDAFTVKGEGASLELTTIMLNINPVHNKKLLDSCKTLKDYSEYTARVREYAKTMTLEAAVELAIVECIRDDILADFLRKNRAEAKSVSIYEYDEEKHMRQVKEEGREEGRAEGAKSKMLELVNKKLEKGKSIEVIATELEESEEVIRKLIEEQGH